MAISIPNLRHADVRKLDGVGVMLEDTEFVLIPKVVMLGGSARCAPLENALADALRLPRGHVVDAILLLDRISSSLDRSPDRNAAYEDWSRWNTWNAWCTPLQLRRGIDGCMTLGRNCGLEVCTVAAMFVVG